MGPLEGYRIIEFAGIGPAPFCGMMLADQGAEVIRIDRPGTPGGYGDVLGRGRKSVAVDLKTAAGRKIVLQLIRESDGLIEGFRPGVMERLGLGPDECLAENEKLVYGRMTGWGQDGPLAKAAGHDINYISLTGALHAIGRPGEKPVPPLNLVGDFGGGGMLLAFGMVCGLLEAAKSGKGQVVDAAMVDGAALLMDMFSALQHHGQFGPERGTHMLDGGAHFYDTYETADGEYISIGAIEPQFYQLLIEKAELDPETFAPQMHRQQWPALKDELTRVFRQKTRQQWCDIMEGTDVCFAPVLSLQEAAAHPHMSARKTFMNLDGMEQPSPAPRFSRTSPEQKQPGVMAGTHSREVCAAMGFTDQEIEQFLNDNVIAQA